ncbi:MAG TPA: primase C-terminal domain-containing protein, partial [Candidatus Brocadiia bacterium]|nr:primase C-terminal domain-containing protein [Candidatus Brocadiia bacterium]
MNTTAPRRTWTTPEALADYVGFVWAPDDLIELRPLPAQRGDRCPWPRQWIPAADLLGMADDLAAGNREGANIYAGVMPRKAKGAGTDADCLPGRVVWADFDGVKPREAWRTIEAAGLPLPGMVLNSGHGSHAYWRLTELTEPERVSRIVASLAAVLGSDCTVKNPSRIMRLPGFLNHKAPAAACELLYCEPGRTVDAGALAATLARFLDAHKPIEAGARPSGHEAAAKAVEGTRDAAPGNGAGSLQRAAAYVATVEGSPAGGRNAAGFRVACLLLRDFGLSEGDAWALLATWNARNAPPLDERELRAVLQSARKHGRHETGQKLNAPRPERQSHEPDTAPRPAAIPATPPASGAAGLAQT